ncbi:MAG: DNA-3-methyladenine glycosylase [Bacteroidia bacterium]
MILTFDFYCRDSVTEIAKDLLGKKLITNINNQITGGIIVETEAYEGVIDKASHAYNNRFTNRTKTMYKSGGHTYVYLCYGIHHLFNVVTNIEGIPHAVLIRAIEPTDGIELMLKRRNKQLLEPKLTNGPGSLTKALGISQKHDAILLTDKIIWIEDCGVNVDLNQIIAGPRVGVGYAGEHSKWPYRFRIKGNKFAGK